MAAEKEIRDALRGHVLAGTSGARETVDEFWVPCSNERADMALIGQFLDGFEIKTERDTLRRLPRQALAYGRLFDHCTLVIAEKHSERAVAMLPSWWGITIVCVNGSVTFIAARRPKPNPAVDPETLVRLLWRDEVMTALLRLGHEPDQRRSRSSLWDELVDTTTLAQLRAIVRRALLSRDPARARIPTQRFATQPLVAGAVR